MSGRRSRLRDLRPVTFFNLYALLNMLEPFWIVTKRMVEEAAYSLGVLGRSLSDRSKVLDALKKALKDTDEFVRLTATEAIGSLGDKTTLSALQEVAEKDGSEWVREVAREAIEAVNKGVSTPREGNTYWLPRIF